MRRVLELDQLSLYEQPHSGPARVLVCSTPASRGLLTDPVSCGLGYRRTLRTALAQAMQALVAADVADLASMPDGAVAVLNVLRGGLSFGVEDAVSQILGLDPMVSFVGTERLPDRPVELSYARWELGSARTLMVGDIIGTGATLTRALSNALELAASQHRPLQSILIFTIGSRLGIERVASLLASWPPAARPAVTIVALEALYELPVPGNPAAFPWYPFDLLRWPANSAPEYELERLRKVGSLFERCAIYDGGVRAFTPAEHAESRRKWWAEVLDRGVPLAELAGRTAGLANYRLPLAQWAQTISWAQAISQAQQPGLDVAAVHDLGRQALQFAEHTDTADYVRSFRIGADSLVEHDPVAGRS